MAGQTFVGPSEDLKIKIDIDLYLDNVMNNRRFEMDQILYMSITYLAYHYRLVEQREIEAFSYFR